MKLLSTVVLFVLMLAIILIAFSACRMYIFSKVRINKYIPLSIAIVLFAIQVFAGKSVNVFVNYGLSIFAVLFFLWFMDIIQTGGPKKKEKQINIRPKAKPNRVKNRNNDNK